MIGAILGDIVGSPYEFDQGKKIKNFGPLFIDESEYTDDSVMTAAVADGLMKAGLEADADTIKKQVVTSLKEWGRRYINAGYGQRFVWWLMLEEENRKEVIRQQREDFI